MPISGLLFGTTHSVEQITNIKSKKKVDKILLKVVKVIKAKGKLDGWVKPTASLSKDLKLSDKTILSIMKTLGAYYQIDLTTKKLDTPMAIVTEIKVKKPKVVNSLYLVDVDEMEVDADDDVQTEDVPDDPGMSLPKPEPAPLEEPHVEPAVPDPLPAESETPPNSGAVIGTVEGELQQDPETVRDPEATASTEGLLDWIFGKRKKLQKIDFQDVNQLLRIHKYIMAKRPSMDVLNKVTVRVQKVPEVIKFFTAHIRFCDIGISLLNSCRGKSLDEIKALVDKSVKSTGNPYSVEEPPQQTLPVTQTGCLNYTQLQQALQLEAKYDVEVGKFSRAYEALGETLDEDTAVEYDQVFSDAGYIYYDWSLKSIAFDLTYHVYPKLMEATNTTLEELQEAITGKRRQSSESLSTEGLSTTTPQAPSSWGSFLNNL